MKTNILKKFYRYDIINYLGNNENIGIELGVAEGDFSLKMMKSKKFKFFYGVDSYSYEEHNDKEYLNTKNKLSIYKNYKLIRSQFKDAINQFEDQYFDFIYIDGFAHTGNNGGKTMFDWYKKVKIGGILSGDDFHDDWPIVKEVVMELAKQNQSDLYITENIGKGYYSLYPSWFIIKKEEKLLTLPVHFSELSSKASNLYELELNKNKNKFNLKYKIYVFLSQLLPKKIFSLLKITYKFFISLTK